jgi:hypothetical protein
MSSSSSNTGPIGTVTGIAESGGGAGGRLSVGVVAWFMELRAATVTGADSGGGVVARA